MSSSSSSSTTQALQIIGISTALMASGGIACLSLFDIPLLSSQPASRSLPQIRWLFSRGSHIFPIAGMLSCVSFAWLAYTSSKPGNAEPLVEEGINSSWYYAAAAVLSIGIAPMTKVMIPTNFVLIKMNEDKGGSRSERSAEVARDATKRAAEESVAGKNDVYEMTDLSGPQEKTREDSSAREDEKVRELLTKFGKLNAVRAVLIGLGGVVGLAGALGDRV